MRLILCLLLLNVFTHGLYAVEDPGLRMQMQADTLLRNMEDHIRHIESLPADQRYKEELKLGPKLLRLERKIRGTKANNKILFLLANWQVTYDTHAAWASIQNLARSPYLPHKGSIGLVKIRYFLKKGDSAQARILAEKITADIPEFMNTVDLVTLYETRGNKAPSYSGKHLGGPYKNPLSDAPETFILYIFANLNNDWQQLHVNKLCNELQRPEYTGKLHVVCVSFDSKYIRALGNWQDISKDSKWDLFWANPSKKGDAEDWKAAWKTYTQPSYVLIGPAVDSQREILEINPSVDELRILAGIKKSSSRNTKSRKNGKGRRKGKGPRW